MPPHVRLLLIAWPADQKLATRFLFLVAIVFKLFLLMKPATDLSRLDPWDLQPHFILTDNKWKNLRTYSGYWKEKEEEFTAIRSAGESSSSTKPSYVGVRKTLEFHLKDGTRGGEGTKTDWIIHEYHNLRKDDTGDTLFLEEDVVFRKVFNNERKSENDRASSLLGHVESCVKSLKDEREWNELVSRSRYSDYNIFWKPMYDDLLRAFLPRPPHWLSIVPSRSGPKLWSNYNGWISKAGVVPHPAERGRRPPRSNGKPHSVWEHFTKIRTSNPDEVYAACHRCDKVLKAHPKKHGTSHLTRHLKTCSSCTNPSTDDDREILHCLRTYKQQYADGKQLEREEINVDLARLDQPDLEVIGPTSCYITRSLNRQTQGGHWKEINKELTAIRMDQKVCWKDMDKEITDIQMDQLFQVQVPQYMGLRRTLQFYHQDGRKLDWIMLEYQQLDDVESPAMFLQEGMVIRKVLLPGRNEVSSALSEVEKLLNADDDDEDSYNGEGVNTVITTPSDYVDTHEGVNNTGTTTSSSDYMDTPVDRKRKRTGAASGHKSEVWMHFTKICTDYGVLLYVVCHTCDRGYTSGCSKNGTSHLRRHHESCASKCRRTGNPKDATTEWEAEIWPLFLVLKNYGETEQHGCGDARSHDDPAC